MKKEFQRHGEGRDEAKAGWRRLRCRKDGQTGMLGTYHDATNLRFVWVLDAGWDRRLRVSKKEEKEEADDVTWHDTRKRNETAPAPRMAMARQPYPDRNPPPKG